MSNIIKSCLICLKNGENIVFRKGSLKCNKCIYKETKKNCSICLKNGKNIVFRKGSLKCNKCIYIERKEYCKEYIKSDRFRKYRKQYYILNSADIRLKRQKRKRDEKLKQKQKLLEKNKIPFIPSYNITLFAYF